ncbi:MAG TPA: glutamine--fructose-6-phosphate transaminase (isomerizing) [Candidatus Saccharimonadales bacterium]|jgi:glucosamine--fructose-6-phosphate aminotransferase (isomerizing)|nr:glutamine--fructose-6-phosphate transaminase (isomerizing) [Candidatus Saccharimonadales bacterium]
MCGIVGYIGPKPGKDIVLDGLEALEYRGYDSAGIALVDGDQSQLFKQVGRVSGLVEEVKDQAGDAHLVIGHTRWATHGGVTEANAHPQASNDGSIFVVHNGIVENFGELRQKLEAEGYHFESQTDTEIVPNLIDYYSKQLPSLDEAFQAALADVRGAYAIAAVSTREPGKLYAARLSSPLVIGVGEGEHILASDPSAIMEHTKKVIYLEDYDLAVITADKVEVTNLKNDKPIEPKAELLDFDNEQAILGDFPNYMLKEIFEAPGTIKNATLGRVRTDQNLVKLGGLETVLRQLQHIDRIVIVACGTASYAGLIGEYLIEELAGIPVEVQLASEFNYRKEPFSRSTVLLAISQSGETADTIAALKKVEDYGALRLGVVNAIGSTIARMTDAGVYCHAGPERAVASTKAFIAQVTVLALIALNLSDGKSPQFHDLLEEFDRLPEKAQLVLDQAENIKQIAEKYADYRDFLFIGRQNAFPSALEGALKLKECSYIHAEGYAAGEMKHGPLAMIDENFPTFAIATDSPLLEKTYSSIQEIRARKGPVVALATEGNSNIAELADDVIYLPPTMEHLQPILHAIATQLFAYYIATKKGLDVDRPRNLAKSVTVE